MEEAGLEKKVFENSGHGSLMSAYDIGPEQLASQHKLRRFKKM